MSVATAEQIKALIKSHAHNDTEHFFTIALQIAAHEARSGHSALAKFIKEQYEQAQSQKRREQDEQATSVPDKLLGIVTRSVSMYSNSQLVVPSSVSVRLDRIVCEYEERDKLANFDLTYRRKLLLFGPSGTGKTMTAHVLAKRLHLPLYVVHLDSILSKYVGESSAKLHLVFDYLRAQKAVYLFDEFDSIAGDRSNGDDVGEMRRLLNSLLLCIENDDSQSYIIAATNKPELIDSALFRRFDDIIKYSLPGEAERQQLIQNTLASFVPSTFNVKLMVQASAELNCAIIARACTDAIKQALMAGLYQVSEESVLSAINERKSPF